MKNLSHGWILLFGIFILSSCGKREVVIIPDIANAPSYVTARYLAFEGVAHGEFSGSYGTRASSQGPGKAPGTSPIKWRHVVPVTSKDWDASQPVPLWVTFSITKKNASQEISALQHAMKRGAVEGLNVDFPERTSGALRGISGWQQAVNDAENRHGIHSDPRAPIVSWRPRR